MKTIAIFLHQPKCSVQSGNGIIKALSPKYRFKVFTKHEIEDDFFDDVDMVCFPGGVGDSDSWDYLLKSHRNRIRKFVNSGGRYLGICMGAYWAASDCFDIIDDTEVEQYIVRPNTDTRRPHAKNMPVTWNGEDRHMYFYDGPAFVGNNFETISTYPNGDAMAIYQNRIGLIGCHPEADKHWYDSYTWMRKHWDGGQHHLLLEFVDKLMEK